MKGVAFAIVGAADIWLGDVRAAEQMPRSVKEGVYTSAQADGGKALYKEKCASCHGAMTSATPDMAPLLNDYSFQTAWRDRSVGEFFTRIRNDMPQDKPRTLSAQQTVEIIAYILQANQLPAGDAPLAEDVEQLKQIRLDAGEP